MTEWITTEISIHINGNPIGKKSHRTFRRGNFTGTYNPQESEEGKWLTEALMQIESTDRPVFGADTPLEIDCVFVFARPKSHYGTGKNSGTVKKSAPVYHLKKPDVSNMIKFAEDCLTGHAWHDDRQVVKVSAIKAWGVAGRTEITIRKI